MLDRDLRDVVVKGDKLFVSLFRAATVLVVDAAGTKASALSPPASQLGTKASVAWRLIEGQGGQAIMLHERGLGQPVSIVPNGYGAGDDCGGAIVDSSASVIDVTFDDQPGFTSTKTLGGTLVGADVALSPDGAQIAVVSIAGADSGSQVQFFDMHATPGLTSSGGSGDECDPGHDRPTPPEGDGAGEGQISLPRPGSYLPPNGEVVAVAYDRVGNVVVQTREPATLQVLTQRMDGVSLSTESRFDPGHQVFHTATKNRIACVSCHPEGGEDGRVWQFASLGLRRTQSLRGGIMNTAPFHWNGDQSDFSALMTDVFQSRMGGERPDAARIAALGAWLDQIPTIPPSPWKDAATVARGKTLFASAGCAACHLGADFTNGQNVDVGTGGPFQVPQLHGLGFRAPYMHTGCAPSLRARFAGDACGGDSRHGNTANLSDDQVGDLIAYLDTL
jgi:hypothetical protein